MELSSERYRCVRGRYMKSQLDDRYMVRIAVEHPILTWLCEHTAYLLNRLEVGHDGKTAYERMKGKRATVLGVELGETISGSRSRLEYNASWRLSGSLAFLLASSARVVKI